MTATQRQDPEAIDGASIAFFLYSVFSIVLVGCSIYICFEVQKDNEDMIKDLRCFFLFVKKLVQFITLKDIQGVNVYWLFFGLVLLGVLLAVIAVMTRLQELLRSRQHQHDDETDNIGNSYSSFLCSAAAAQALLGDCFSSSSSSSSRPSSSDSGNTDDQRRRRRGRPASSSRSSYSISERFRRMLMLSNRLPSEEREAYSRGEIDLARLQLMLTDRDFDGNDYELLSRLDEDLQASEQHNRLGATAAELERLPTHVIQNTEKLGSNKKCSICLETYKKGDVVRILPCLHQYHSECADVWLRLKCQCPVCNVLF